VKSYSDAPAQAFVPVCRPGTNRLPGGECIPPFLEPWKFKILLAGKYLNVIKECGIEIADWEAQDNIVAAHAEGALIRMDQPKYVRSIIGLLVIVEILRPLPAQILPTDRNGVLPFKQDIARSDTA
jgi:hypothetical protein